MAGAPPAPLTVKVQGPPVPETEAAGSKTLTAFVGHARKVRFTFTLSEDLSIRQAQWNDLNAKLQSFLSTYATVQGYCATCQSNENTSCPDKS